MGQRRGADVFRWLGLRDVVPCRMRGGEAVEKGKDASDQICVRLQLPGRRGTLRSTESVTRAYCRRMRAGRNRQKCENTEAASHAQSNLANCRAHGVKVPCLVQPAGHGGRRRRGAGQRRLASLAGTIGPSDPRHVTSEEAACKHRNASPRPGKSSPPPSYILARPSRPATALAQAAAAAVTVAPPHITDCSRRRLPPAT